MDYIILLLSLHVAGATQSSFDQYDSNKGTIDNGKIVKTNVNLKRVGNLPENDMDQANFENHKKKRKGIQSSGKRLPKSALLARAIHSIETGMDLYHRWWIGHNPGAEPLKPHPSGASHTILHNSIFATTFSSGLAYSSNLCLFKIQLFLDSARKVFKDDIVLALTSEQLSHANTLSFLSSRAVVIYEITSELCSPGADGGGITCGSTDERVPASVFQFFLFERWAAKYANNTSVLICDFAKTLFQSNPFSAESVTTKGNSLTGSHLPSPHTSSPFDWSRESALQIFVHFQPNSILGRNTSARATFLECYGADSLVRFRHRPLVSERSFLGTRDGVLLWSHHITQELQEAPGRYTDGTCSSQRILQAMVLWLAYSPRLRSLLSILVVPQGEGVVNPLDGLLPDDTASSGRPRPMRGSLEKFWRVLDAGTGDGSQQRVLNWGGDVSPVVQYTEELEAQLSSILRTP